MLLEGVFLPLTTPFHSDGRLFLRKLEANVARYSLTPASGMIVGQLEPDALTDAETVQLLHSAMHSAAETKVMIAAVGRDSLARTLALADIAAQNGFDVVAVRAPAFAEQTQMAPEVMNYFRMVADRSALPVLLETTALPAAWLAELASHPNILGLITGREISGLVADTAGISREVTVTATFAAATNRMVQRGTGLITAANLTAGSVIPVGAPAVKTRKKKVSFQILASGTANMLDAWRAGASGAVPRLSPCAPQACCEVWQAFKDGDQGLADEKQERILRAATLTEGTRGLAAIKYGCDVNGYFGGWPRLPLLPLEGEAKAALEQSLASLKT